MGKMLPLPGLFSVYSVVDWLQPRLLVQSLLASITAQPQAERLSQHPTRLRCLLVLRRDTFGLREIWFIVRSLKQQPRPLAGSMDFFTWVGHQVALLPQ